MEEKVSTQSRPRIVFLDTLRFIAAAAVLFQHIVELSGPIGEQIAGFLSPGVFGVVLFFIISGFVIPMTAKDRFDLRKFAVRRVFRIYPLVITTFALVATLGHSGILPDLKTVISASPRDWLANLLLIQDYVGALKIWGVTWTLNLEFVWYAIFALTFLIIGVRFDGWLAVFAPCILLVLICVSMGSGYRLPIGRLGLIYAAIVGARIYRFHIFSLSLRRVIMDICLFLALMAIGNIVAFGYFSHPTITMNQSLYPWLAAPILFAGVLLVPAIRESNVFNSRVAGWLGSISFSTYMLHGFAIAISKVYFPETDLILFSVILTLIFSALGYYLIEVPGQKLGHRISR